MTTRTRARSKLRAVAGRLLLVATSVGLLVVLAEGVARLVLEPQPLRRVWDPFAYRIPHPGLVDRFTNSDGREVTVRLNELGMRGPSIAEAPPIGAMTIVFLGGSTTENYPLERSATFPELLGAELGRRLGTPVRTFNAGMASASTSTSLARLQHQVLALEPTLVVVQHAINDLIGGFHTDFRPDGRHLPRPPGVDWRPRSYLFAWLRNRRRAPRERRPTPGSAKLRRLDYGDFPARAVFARNLRSMAAIAAVHRTPILFVTQPTMYAEGLRQGSSERFFMVETLIALGMTPPDTESLAAGMRAFNEVTLQLPRSEWVHTYDLAADVPEEWELFEDECHLTAAGNRAVAAALAPILEDVVRRTVDGRGSDGE